MAKDKVIDPVGRALTLAARRHRVRTAALLAEIDLFPGQDKVLQSLAAAEALSMSEIAAELGIRPPTASKMIARMAAQGFVERRGRDGDARLVLVSITEEGRARVDALKRIAKRVEREALAEFDDKDARRLRRLLKKLARNLGGKAAAEDEAEGDNVAAAAVAEADEAAFQG
jgi:DNA-binding MarR family transcriptional regulator